MEDGRQTLKVSVYLGEGKRTTCKIKHTQIHNSNIITFDKEIDGGIIIYYKGKEYKFNMVNRAIQYFGFLGDNPIIYCDNKILMFRINKILNSNDNIALRDCIELVEDNASYSRWVSLNGKVYLEKCKDSETFNHLLHIDENDVVIKEDINKGSFMTAVIKEKTIREFLFTNLVSINNSIDLNKGI